MKNLLQISTTPIQLEVNVTRASLESPAKQLPKMNVKTEKGGFRMEATPVKLNIDTYQARSSMGMGNLSMPDFYNEEAQRGIRLSYEGLAKIVEDGNMLGRGATPVEVSTKNHRASFNIQTVLDFIPKTGANISWEDGALNVNYQVDDRSVDWEHLEAARLIFNPGSIEISVEQHPQVVIEYVGEPIYVPPSANPNYDG